MPRLMATAFNGSTDTNTVTTSAIDTTGATLLVVVAQSASFKNLTITDGLGNTWFGLTIRRTTNTQVQIFYAASPIVGSGHTFAATLSASSPALTVMAFSEAVSSSVFDQENGTTTTSGTSLATGSITPTSDSQILVVGLATFTGTIAPVSVTTPFALASQFNLAAAKHEGGAAGFAIQGSAAAINPTFSVGAATQMAVAIASFQTIASAARGGAWAFAG